MSVHVWFCNSHKNTTVTSYRLANRERVRTNCSCLHKSGSISFMYNGSRMCRMDSHLAQRTNFEHGKVVTFQIFHIVKQMLANRRGAGLGLDLRLHRRECPAITYMAMGFRPRSFPVGGMYVKGIGRLTKVKKITLFSFHCFLNVKSTSQVIHVYLTGNEKRVREAQHLLAESVCNHSSAHAQWYPALVPCSATAVEADFGVRPKVRQYTRQVLKARG